MIDVHDTILLSLRPDEAQELITSLRKAESAHAKGPLHYMKVYPGLFQFRQSLADAAKRLDSIARTPEDY